MSSSVKKPNLLVFTTVTVFSAIVPLAIYKWPKSASEFGDAFGFMAALMGALALFYLSSSVWLQARSNSAAAKSIKAQAKLAAMTALSEHLRCTITDYRSWANAAQSDEKRRLWNDKKQQAQKDYSRLIREIRLLAGVDIEIFGAEGDD